MPRPDEDLPGGCGRRCSGPAEYPRSFDEASLALHVQEAVGAEPGATSYEDLGVYQLLTEVARADGIERFARTWLGPLLTYDEHRNADLLATLRLYLEAGATEAAARAPSIHRSTLKYRLQRIGQVSGHDLADPTTFNLHLAIRAWQTLTALRSAAG